MPAMSTVIKNCIIVFILISVFSLLNICSVRSQDSFREMKIKLKSSAFKNNEMLPKKYTCDGIGISPPLLWSDIPKAAQSLAIISDDPDAPGGVWVHWVMYNIPPQTMGLNEGVLPVEEFAHAAKQGLNDFQNIGYGAPCPPSGTHRYFFKLYALDTILNLESKATKDQLLKAMEGHILAKAELVGKYKR